jgi:hypothetical protein
MSDEAKSLRNKVIVTNFITIRGSGRLSRYSNLLRHGQAVDRIPVEARFSMPPPPASDTMGTRSLSQE